MNNRATALLGFALLFGAAIAVLPEAEATTTPMKFGMDAHSIGALGAAGVKPDYATLWVGPWNLNNWGGFDRSVADMKAAGVTPAIHFYYWGDDISVSCIEKGCWSSLHNVQKNRAGWDQLAAQFVGRLNAQMAGKTVVIFLETEFNKGDVSTYEAFDGLLAAKADYFHTKYPASKVVLALGNWNSGAWGTWDRAAAESDMIGIQGMRGSTRDSQTSYLNLYEATLAGAKTAKAKFGKPVAVTDLALSSYPDSTYATHQASELRQFFANLPALKDAGVTMLMYRTWKNNDHMDTANYYGVAERHWGLTYTSGVHKASAKVWVDGVKAERGGTTTSGTSATATFTPKSVGNDWWIDVAVKSSSPISKVEVQVNDGSWTALPKTSWGTYAKSVHAPDGSKVEFRATTGAGTVLSPAYTWGAASGSGTTSSTTTFTPKSVGNDWWIDVAVKSSSSVSKVEVQVNDGSWTALPKTSWGTYAKSVHAPNGAKVEFRATDTSGKVTTSSAYTWT